MTPYYYHFPYLCITISIFLIFMIVILTHFRDFVRFHHWPATKIFSSNLTLSFNLSRVSINLHPEDKKLSSFISYFLIESPRVRPKNDEKFASQVRISTPEMGFRHPREYLDQKPYVSDSEGWLNGNVSLWHISKLHSNILPQGNIIFKGHLRSFKKRFHRA